MRSAKRITIVGGGSSAWMTAALLRNNIPKEHQITVIDKEVGSPIGVGEATILSFKSFMDDCGFSVLEWYKDITATFKGGILFKNWKGKDDHIWHPFAFPTLNSLRIRDGDNTSVHELWTNFQEDFPDKKRYTEIHYNLAVEDNKVDPNNLGIYSFHVDAGLLVQFIKKKLIDKIEFLQSKVVAITTDEDGYIVSLGLADGTVHESDIFIDCTGFKGILKKNNERVDLSDRLYVDTAVAGRVEYLDRDKELKPYTTCDAVDHGWIWHTPVRERIGSGLVFNRSITDVEEAKDFFVDYWDGRVDRDNLRVLDWAPFYNKNFWEKNVVNIGLSAGFIEPLESTGLALISAGAWELLNRLKTRFYDDNDITLYNAQMTCFFENSIDFVNMHYSKPKSEGKFWQWVSDVYKPSPMLEWYTSDLKHAFRDINMTAKEVFSGANWFCWLNQLDYPVCPKDVNLPPPMVKSVLNNFYNVERDNYNYLPSAATVNDNFAKLTHLSPKGINPWA